MIIKRKLYALINQSEDNNKINNSVTSEGALNNNAAPQTPDTLTAKDLQIEQMKLQRQILQTQRMRQKMESEERLHQSKQLAQLQRAQQKEDQSEKENQVRVRKLQDDSSINPADRNWNLVKSKAKTTAPISMKQGN